MQISQIFSQAGTDNIEISKSQNANNEGVALPKQNVTDDVEMRIFQRITTNIGRHPKKKREFFPKGGEGLLNSQNFCKFTKWFLVYQNHF